MGLFSSAITYDKAVRAFVSGWTASVDHQSNPITVEDVDRRIKSYGFDVDFFNEIAQESKATSDDFFILGREMRTLPKGAEFFNVLAKKVDTNPYISSTISAAIDTVPEIGNRGLQAMDIVQGAISLPVIIAMVLGIGIYSFMKYRK